MAEVSCHGSCMWRFLAIKHMAVKKLAWENIRFSSLFADGDVSSRNVPGGEERGETDVFAGYEKIYVRKSSSLRQINII